MKRFTLIAVLSLAAACGGQATDEPIPFQPPVGDALAPPTISPWALYYTIGDLVGPFSTDMETVVANKIAAIGCWTGDWVGEIYFRGTDPTCPGGQSFANVPGACIRSDSGSWGRLEVHSTTYAWSGSPTIGIMMQWGGSHCGKVFTSAEIAAVTACVVCRESHSPSYCSSQCQ